MATYTAAQIKDVLNRKGAQSGFAFDAFGPYFANAERLKAMKAAFKEMRETDDAREPAAKRITPRTVAAVDRWFAFLANRYGI